jgi:hypothetical protein
MSLHSYTLTLYTLHDDMRKKKEHEHKRERDEKEDMYW